MSEHHPPEVELAWRSIPWRTAAGWMVVLVIGWRFLIRPVIDYWLATQGLPVPPPPTDLSLMEVFALLGLPVGGAFADRLSDPARSKTIP